MAFGPVYFGLKAVGPYIESIVNDNGQIFEELLSLHMKLVQEVVNYN